MDTRNSIFNRRVLLQRGFDLTEFDTMTVDFNLGVFTAKKLDDWCRVSPVIWIVAVSIRQ